MRLCHKALTAKGKLLSQISEIQMNGMNWMSTFLEDNRVVSIKYQKYIE